jgi:hypothetical protein
MASSAVSRSTGASDFWMAVYTVFVIHALSGHEAIDQLREAGTERVISSDSCIHQTNAVRLAPILAAALQDELGS